LGRHNLPGIGLFAFRAGASLHDRGTPFALPGPDRRFLFHPLGRNLPLYRRPATKTDLDTRTDRRHLPTPITRRPLHEDPASFYGAEASICVFVDGTPVPPDGIAVCHLADLPTTGDPDRAEWQIGGPADRTRIDPELGRLVLGAGLTGEVAVRYHTATVADLGGGAYPRSAALAEVAGIGARTVVLRDSGGSVADALTGLDGAGAVVLDTTAILAGPVRLAPAADGVLALVAADGRAPVLELTDDLVVAAAPDSTVVLDGLLVTGGGLLIEPPEAGVATVVIRDCTLVPGRSLHRDGSPVFPTAPSVVVAEGELRLRLERSIVGGIHAAPQTDVALRGCVVQAFAGELAIGGPGGAAGGRLSADASTVIGAVRLTSVGTVSNCLLAGQEGEPGSVTVERRQKGCVRFSFVPVDALVPRRFRCQPDGEAAARDVRPRFASLRYGDVGYAQLRATVAPEVRQGADDESELGAFHDLHERARISNLCVRLGDFLPAATEAGLFFES
jgi:hypothetical protein